MPAADLLITGARVRTLDPARPEATAVAVRGGTIVGVGDAEDLRELKGAGTEHLDLGGAATLTPGLTDAHSHPVWGLEMATGVDLTAVRDLGAKAPVLVAGPDGALRTTL